MYEKLKDNTDLIETGTEVEAFFEAKQNSPTGALSSIEEAKTQALIPEIAEANNLSQLLTIKEQLTAQLIAADTLVDSTATQQEMDSWQTVTSGISQSIATVNTQLTQLYQTIDAARLQQVEQVTAANTSTAVNVQIEDNLKLLNDIYLSTVALDVDTFTANQLTDLYYLAFQCPLSGGQAVYRARSLLALVIDTFYNDREICAAAGIAYKKEQEATSILKDTAMLFDKIRISTLPNPANAYLLLQSNIASDETFTLKVYDNMGRTIKEERVSLATKRFKLETQALPSGLYFLKLFNSAQAMYSTKFNVQH